MSTSMSGLNKRAGKKPIPKIPGVGSTPKDPLAKGDIAQFEAKVKQLKEDKKYAFFRDPGPDLFTGDMEADKALAEKLMGELDLKKHAQEIHKKNEVPPLHQPKGKKKSPRPSPGLTAPHEGDLVASMASRLRGLELQLKEAKKEISKKDDQIVNLKREKDALSTAGGDERAAEEIFELKTENARLRTQIQQMEHFLNDYGLIWVGDQTDDYEEPSGPEPLEEEYFPNVQVLFAKIRELNDVAGDGSKEVVVKNGVKKLEATDPIPLTLYKDGMLLKKGPFRAYSDPATVSFLKDLEDGYFPYEMRYAYPEGDCTNSEYSGYKGFDAFKGTGNVLGGDKKPSSIVSGEPSNVHGMSDLGQQREGDTAAFLRKLPKHVIKNGRVIDIRADIANMIGKGESGGPLPCSTPRGITVAQTPIMEELGRTGTPGDVTTLRIKSQDGKETLILKLRYEDTIADAKRFINKNWLLGEAYTLRTAFPARIYDDETQTLKEADLVPNATLLVHPLNAPENAQA